MDVIVVSHRRSRTWRFAITPGRVHLWLAPLLLLALMAGLGFGAGRWLGQTTVRAPEELVAVWAAQVAGQRLEVAQVRVTAEENARALSQRVAQLQAQFIRLDAAGERMTEIAGIDPAEFNFGEPPAVGGPEPVDAFIGPAGGDPLLASILELESRLGDRERSMRVIEDILLSGKLQREFRPSGRPVEAGYVSSAYGWRSDPFTGRQAMHTGIDFAGARGSEVLAVAGGIVGEAGVRDGYGLTVEINHGNGYATRYGHNAKVLVQPGARVVKGQKIATMGSSGRSTGPHVHFEVLLNGTIVDPAQYVQAAQ